MVIQNRTNLNGQEVYDSLLKASKKGYTFKFSFSAAIIIVGVAIVFIALGMKKTDSITIGSMFVAIGLMYLMMSLVSFIRLPSSVKKRNAKSIENGIIYEYKFKEESFQVSVNNGDSNSKFGSRYEELKKIVEYDDRIVFITDSTALFICKKEGFESTKELELFFYGLGKHKIKIKQKLTDIK